MLSQPYCCVSNRQELLEKIVITDNFYTRHMWAQALKLLSGGRISVLGTVRLSYVDALLKPLMKEKVEEMSSATQGSWLLIKCYQYHQDHQKLKKAHQNTQKKVFKEKKKPFEPSLVPSPKAGYLIFKDKKLDIFYCSCLNGTMTNDIMDKTFEEAIQLVYSLSPLRRWTDDCVIERKTFMAPQLVVLY